MIPMSNNNDETIKIIADMLQMQGDEDMALELEEAWQRAKHELERVKRELERVKGIAERRLDRIADLENGRDALRERGRQLRLAR